MKPNKNQIWRSKKSSRLYTVLGISSPISEDEDDLVIYENDRGDLTHRPLKEFEEKFEYISERKVTDTVIEPLKHAAKEFFRGLV